MWKSVAAMLAVLLVTASARAQTPTGTILGSVKDAQGAVVPGATVAATNLGTQYSRSTVTDGAGEYALRLLPVGARVDFLFDQISEKTLGEVLGIVH